ncbi:MAG: NAD(P)/FAD-dependent oxidoreductase [Ignisphaera sp.]|nr:NAD(P)/FAD-dependent oxidoreductase [Ignisphaera sp.]
MVNIKYDVIVVGGGVAGLYASYLLAKAGLKIATIEMKSEKNVGNKVCGDAIGAHHFIELDLEPPVQGFDKDHEYDGVTLISPDESNSIVVTGKGYSLNRRNFGLRLYRMAVNQGAEMFLEHSFLKPIIEGSRVVGVEVINKSGSKKGLEGKVVIDASGPVAVVRRSLPSNWWVSEPIPKEDYNVTYREVVMGDFELDERYAYIYLNVDVAPGGYWWLFPKGRGIYNIGLGVQWKDGNPNPKTQFQKYVLPKLSKRINEVIHQGGGLVPTRRPIPCMVWNGFIVVGDAAATANPVHGGGIGSAMLSAKIASEVIVEALEKGDVNLKSLWSYHARFHRAYGAKQASLDVLRMFLQKMTNSELNFIFKSRLVNGDEVYDIGSKGGLSISILERIRSFTSLLTKPRFLLKLYKLKQYMDKARELYLNFPQDPSRYTEWYGQEQRFFKEYIEWLSTEMR